VKIKSKAKPSTVKLILTKKGKKGIAKVAIKIYVKRNEMGKKRKKKKTCATSAITANHSH